MTEISIDFEPGALDKLNRQLLNLGNKMPNALRNAVNTTASTARNDLKNTTASMYTVARREIQSAVSLSRAVQGDNPTAIIKARGGVLSLTKYKTSVTKRKGASAAVKGSTKKQLVGSKGIKAFKGPGGNIFQRESSSRTPIKKLSGPSIPNLYREDGAVYEKVGPTIEDNLRKNLEAQIKKYMAQM